MSTPRRNKKLSIYLSGQEYEALHRQAEVLQGTMAQVGRAALDEHLRARFAQRGEPYPGQQRLPVEQASQEANGNG